MRKDHTKSQNRPTTKYFISVIVKTQTPFGRYHCFDGVSISPPHFFKSIKGGLWQDSFFSSICHHYVYNSCGCGWKTQFFVTAHKHAWWVKTPHPAERFFWLQSYCWGVPAGRRRHSRLVKTSSSLRQHRRNSSFMYVIRSITFANLSA